MKKIGFVDHYISEWHANNYPAWIKEACRELGCEYEVAYAWAEREISPVDNKSTGEWCHEMGITPCETVEQLCEKSDVIVILAPSDPDCHLRYAERVLPFGKPTYIDKTFAPDLKTAKRIFEIAKRHGTPFFTSSALRYATELALCPAARCTMTTGGGSSVSEYIIHQAEMIVRKLGVGATRIRAERIFDTGVRFAVEYADGRYGEMTYMPDMPFTVCFADGEGNAVYERVQSKYFDGLIRDMLRFFETGEVSFDPAETLEVMKLREGALLALKTPDEWLCPEVTE